MTLEEAIKDPKRNMLLQCVGAGNYLAPDFIQGELAPEQGFLICSDGFRHVISTGEIAEGMRLPSSHHEDLMRKRLDGLTELCKQRGEKDNITSIWIHRLGNIHRKFRIFCCMEPVEKRFWSTMKDSAARDSIRSRSRA